MKYTHHIEMKVRDYECDMQGIVNNGVYQNYLEHARHEYLLSRGINFSEVTASGIHLVVIQVELAYRYPLRSNDHFKICTNIARQSRLKFEFHQNIYRLSDNRLILQGRIIATSIDKNGKPTLTDNLQQLFD